MAYYAALFTAGGEVTGAGYARKLTATGIIDGRTRNTDQLTWGPLTEPWGTITLFKYFAAISGGDPIHSGPLLSSMVTQTGKRYRVAVGAVVFSEALYDAAQFDEVLFGDSAMAFTLLPVGMTEITPPAPSAFNVRVQPWGARGI